MKNLKRVFVLFLLMFLFSTSVNAINVTTNNIQGTVDTNSKQVMNKSSVTITNVTSSDTFKAYRVAKAFYNATTNEVTYEFTKDFKDFLDQSNNTLTMSEFQEMVGSPGGSISTTANALDTLMSNYAAYVKIRPNDLDNNDIKNMNVTGTTTTLSNAEVGSYMVLPITTSASPKKIYGVMLASISLKGVDSSWDLDTTKATIEAKVSEVNITKTVDGSTTATKNIGETFKYKITVDVPNFPLDAKMKEFSVEDTLPNGIDLVSTIENLVIKDGSDQLSISDVKSKSISQTDPSLPPINALEGNLYNGSRMIGVVKVIEKEIVVDFSVTDVSSSTLTIEYDAKLNNNAILGPTGNTNKVVYKYTNDPYFMPGTASGARSDENTKFKVELLGGNETNKITLTPVENETIVSGQTEKEASATVYTYGIKVNKIAADTDKTLKGAQFDVCSDVNCTTVVGKIENESYTLDGVSSGTFYVKETKAPTGYKIANEPISVTINTNNDYTTIDFPNYKQGLLPSTGGVGAYIYISLGSILVIGALFLVLKHNKNNIESN